MPELTTADWMFNNNLPKPSPKNEITQLNEEQEDLKNTPLV